MYKLYERKVMTLHTSLRKSFNTPLKNGIHSSFHYNSLLILQLTVNNSCYFVFF
jgi:hypothetical protein